MHHRKSTYIKQVALLTILGQIGCYVPATQAVIPLRERLLSRIGMTDDLEHNLSTFLTEMKECAYILDNATKKSIGNEYTYMIYYFQVMTTLPSDCR